MTPTPTRTATELAEELRSWARGMNTIVAGTEMLIRAGYARPGSVWVRFDVSNEGRPWIDFAAIPELAAGKSSGEQRFLRIAASIAADEPIVLGDEITGLDYQHTALVLAALAHAAGFGQESRTTDTDTTGKPALTQPALIGWPSPLTD